MLSIPVSIFRFYILMMRNKERTIRLIPTYVEVFETMSYVKTNVYNIQDHKIEGITNIGVI